MTPSVFWQFLVLIPALADLPTADVETLKTGRHTGQFVQMSDSAVRLLEGGAQVDLALADVLEIRFTSQNVPDPIVGPRVVLIDGTRVTCREFSVSRGRARLQETAQFGSFEVPIALISEVRFGISTGKLDEAWKALLGRESKTDLLVVKKDEVLDHLGGVTGDVGAKVSFLLDGEEVSVAREKVYGIIFRRKAPKLPKNLCQITLGGGDILHASSMRFSEGQLQAQVAGSVNVRFPLEAVSNMDFSAGKIRYLSAMEPREVLHVPYFDETSYREYRRDRSLDGPPITVGGKSYSRGLAIYSQTTLRYRIGGEYSRFQAILGIDDAIRGLGSVQVVISGDGRTLFEGMVHTKEMPRAKPLDLDVTGVRDLEILVDFGDDDNTGDYLDLADARLLK